MKPKDTANDKAYHPPCIRDFGDLKKITQGSSGGSKDGGATKSSASGQL